MTNTTIAQAVIALRQGDVVGFPTETVYGLGADAQNADAIAKVYALKERPSHYPLIVHLQKTADLSSWASVIPDLALQLAEAFWPGPLTLILSKQPHVLDQVTANQNTVGLRVPCHPIAQSLLQQFGSGIAAPSANKFTHVSPTTAAGVREEFGESLSYLLDEGRCTVGLESTIVDLSQKKPVILRPGMIGFAALKQVTGLDIPLVTSLRPVPGGHQLHYAPQTKVLLGTISHLLQFIIENPSFKIAMMVFEKVSEVVCASQTMLMPHSPERYAFELYKTLRDFDARGVDIILIEAPPNLPSWAAIHDRLNKASAAK